MQASDFPRIETLNRRRTTRSATAVVDAGGAISSLFGADGRPGRVLSRRRGRRTTASADVVGLQKLWARLAWRRPPSSDRALRGHLLPRAGEGIAATLWPSWPSPPPPAADERVAFPSASGEALGGDFAKPAGAGPFPAVVLLHSCLGLPANRRAIEREHCGLRAMSRSLSTISRPRPQGDLRRRLPRWRSRTPMAALAVPCRALPAVDPARIAVFGFSQGADTALTIAASGGRPSSDRAGPRIQGRRGVLSALREPSRARACASPPSSRRRRGRRDAGGRLRTARRVAAAGRCRASSSCPTPATGSTCRNSRGGRRVLGMRLSLRCRGTPRSGRGPSSERLPARRLAR